MNTPAMTANPSTDPPILRLNQDLLWSIFALNADMFSPPTDKFGALRNTWSTSQVCKSWRDFMLATPFLWGRLIDFEAFSLSNGRPTDDWAQEVLRRSGSAVLWIRAHYVDDWQLLFFDILKKYWHRIQRLVFYISARGLKQLPHDQFYLPAPHLQVFELDQYRDTDIRPTRPLFADYAPALREFRFSGYRFNNQANWLSNLSSLHIGRPFGFQEVLPILQRIPNLHYLYVDRLVALTGTAQTLPNIDVHLPNLSRCIFDYGDFESSIALLKHLDMPSTCHLEFRPDPISPTGVSEDFLKSSFKLLSMFAQRYLQSDRSRRLRLVQSHSHHCFSWLLKDDISSDDHVFHIIIRMQPKLSPSIYDEFSFPQLSKITELDLDIESEDFILIEAMPILSSMSSIKSITLNAKSLDHFASWHRVVKQRGDASPLIFPNLEIMGIKGNFTGKDLALLKLLEFRAHRGHIVKVLDFRCSDAMLTPPLQYLEEMHGLHVLWTDAHSGKTAKYECGSGDPERLPPSLRSRRL